MAPDEPTASAGLATETALYRPVKTFLEARGFEVKGELRGCDVVGISGDEPVRVVIGELKLGFNLELVLQAVERHLLADELWLAIPAKPRGRERDPRVRRLCHLLGVGLLLVFATGQVEIAVEPGAWRPRKNLKERSRLVLEHRRRRGDPTSGGSTRVPIMTAYRQQALGCAQLLATGLTRPKELSVHHPDAARVLHQNVYGWFVRTARGCYALSEAGRAALESWEASSG